MIYQFKPAVRESVGLLIGLIGASGSGKTFSAMRIASGIVGNGSRFAVIDTESRRALHYADQFVFDHCELRLPFRPEAYMEAIKAADQAGYKAIIVDSCSHEWAGEGGILDWQEEELTRMAGDDYRKRETCKMASWIKPKMAHKQMVQRLLQCTAHLILCFRAEEKVKMEKDAHGKMQIVPIGFQPICSKETPYELTVSFLLSPDKPGFPQPIKLQEQHKIIFPLTQELGEKSGIAIAEWAKGKIIAPKQSSIPESKQPLADPSTELLTTVQNILDIVIRPSKLGKNPRYIITDANKVGYSTFSKTLATLAKEAKEKGVRVELGYEKGKYGNELKTVVLVKLPKEDNILMCKQDTSIPASITACKLCSERGECSAGQEILAGEGLA